MVPQENTIYGSVIETYDGLRSGRAVVRGDVVLRISHCLLVREGLGLAEIGCILSHEQVRLEQQKKESNTLLDITKALGQCRKYLSRFLPNVRIVKTTSTAAAAEAVLADPTKKSAAIASRLCVEVFKGLTLLEENIQDESGIFFFNFLIIHFT